MWWNITGQTTATATRINDHNGEYVPWPTGTYLWTRYLQSLRSAHRWPSAGLECTVWIWNIHELRKTKDMQFNYLMPAAIPLNPAPTMMTLKGRYSSIEKSPSSRLCSSPGVSVPFLTLGWLWYTLFAARSGMCGKSLDKSGLDMVTSCWQMVSRASSYNWSIYR